jgi:hypothetical protein
MSRIIRVKVVPDVIGSQVLGWMGRIMNRAVLIHNPIATAAIATNKAVDLLPLFLLRRRPCSRSFKAGAIPLFGTETASNRQTHSAKIAFLSNGRNHRHRDQDASKRATDSHRIPWPCRELPTINLRFKGCIW